MRPHDLLKMTKKQLELLKFPIAINFNKSGNKGKNQRPAAAVEVPPSPSSPPRRSAAASCSPARPGASRLPDRCT